MQTTSQSLHNQEINHICSTTDLCIEVIPHEETNAKQIDVDVALHPQEVTEPIYDDDFLPKDQLINTALFHEEDRAVMFKNPEEC